MAVRLWTPEQDLDPSFRLNGGIWDPADATPDSSGLVQFAPDRWGVRPQGQPDLSRRVSRQIISGFPALVWPNSSNSLSLNPNQSFAPAYWLFIMRYQDGVSSSWLANTYPNPVSSGVTGSNTNRVMGDQSGEKWFQTSVWTGVSRKDAGQISDVALPMPMSIVEFSGPPSSATWSIGRTSTNGQGGRSWQGAMWYVMALGVLPTGDTLSRIQGAMAWRFGIQSQLPSGHPYRNAAPTVDDGSVEAKGRSATAARGSGRASFSIQARGRGAQAGVGAGIAVLALSAAGSAAVSQVAGGVASLSLSASGGAETAHIASGVSVFALVASGGALTGQIARGRARTIRNVPMRWAYAVNSKNIISGPNGLNYTRVVPDA